MTYSTTDLSLSNASDATLTKNKHTDTFHSASYDNEQSTGPYVMSSYSFPTTTSGDMIIAGNKRACCASVT